MAQSGVADKAPRRRFFPAVGRNCAVLRPRVAGQSLKAPLGNSTGMVVPGRGNPGKIPFPGAFAR
jgi:hypothetical protein